MVLEWSPFNSVSNSPTLHSKLLLLLKIEISFVVQGWPPSKIVSGDPDCQAKNRKKGDEILIVHCCFSISQNELKFKLQLHVNE